MKRAVLSTAIALEKGTPAVLLTTHRREMSDCASSPIRPGQRFNFADYVPGFDPARHQIDPEIYLEKVYLSVPGKERLEIHNVSDMVFNNFISTGGSSGDLFLMALDFQGLGFYRSNDGMNVPLALKVKGTFHLKTNEVFIEAPGELVEGRVVVGVDIHAVYNDKPTAVIT